MEQYVMTTWSNPCNSDDDRLLCSWVYDIDMGWIGKRFNTEEEAQQAAKEYMKHKQNHSIDSRVGYSPETTYSLNDMYKYLKPLPIKL